MILPQSKQHSEKPSIPGVPLKYHKITTRTTMTPPWHHHEITTRNHPGIITLSGFPSGFKVRPHPGSPALVAELRLLERRRRRERRQAAACLGGSVFRWRLRGGSWDKPLLVERILVLPEGYIYIYTCIYNYIYNPICRLYTPIICWCKPLLRDYITIK